MKVKVELKISHKQSQSSRLAMSNIRRGSSTISNFTETGGMVDRPVLTPAMMSVDYRGRTGTRMGQSPSLVRDELVRSGMKRGSPSKKSDSMRNSF